MSWGVPQSIRYVVLKENISLSQRIEAFSLDVWEGDGWRTVHAGTVVGYKRIVSLQHVMTDRLRLRITDSRNAPTLACVGVYG